MPGRQEMGIDAEEGHIWTNLDDPIHTREQLVSHIRWLYRYIELMKQDQLLQGHLT